MDKWDITHKALSAAAFALLKEQPNRHRDDFATRVLGTLEGVEIGGLSAADDDDVRNCAMRIIRTALDLP